MPTKSLTLLLEVHTDGCTYSSAHALLAFTDQSVAELVACELNNKFANPFRSYETTPVEILEAADEGAVLGIVDSLIKNRKLEI